MRYMLFIKYPTNAAIRDVPPALYAAMGALVEEYIEKGMFLDGAGLQPPARATHVRVAGGAVTVTEGLRAEATEVVSGYSLIDVPTHADAVALATRFMELHRIHWPAIAGECEVRPLENAGESS